VLLCTGCRFLTFVPFRPVSSLFCSFLQFPTLDSCLLAFVVTFNRLGSFELPISSTPCLDTVSSHCFFSRFYFSRYVIVTTLCRAGSCRPTSSTIAHLINQTYTRRNKPGNPKYTQVLDAGRRIVDAQPFLTDRPTVVSLEGSTSRLVGSRVFSRRHQPRSLGRLLINDKNNKT